MTKILSLVTGLFAGGQSYMLIAAVLLALGGGLTGWALWERGNAANARAALASAEATVNELQAAHRADLAAMSEQSRLYALAQSTIAQAGARQAEDRSALAQAQRKVNDVALPHDCQSPDARDAAVLDGLRGILAAPASTDR